MPDRVVKTTLIIDDHGAVRVVKGVGEESARTEGKLSHLDKQAKGLGKTFGGLKGAITGGLGLLGAGGIAFGLSSVVSKTKEVAQETEKFSAITGIGATASLRYTQALKARGLSGESVTKAFGFLAKNLRTAELQEEKFGKAQVKSISKGKELTTELGKQAKAIKELGFSATQFSGLPEEAKLNKIVQAFEALPDGMKKTRLERELFGRGGNQLSVVLDKNNLGLSHQLDLVKKFYPTLKGGSQGLKELNEKQAESKMAWEGLIFTLGTGLIPILTKLMSKFSQIVVEVERGKGPWGEVRKNFEAIVAFIRPLWQGFEKLVGPANALTAAVIGLTALKVSSFAGLKAGLSSAFGPLIAAALAAAAIKKSLDVKKPSKAPSQGLGSDLLGFATGGLLGNPATSPLNVGRAAVEDLSGGGARRGPAAGVTGGVAAGVGHSKVELHVDGHKIAETLLRNPRARREIAEATTIYGHTMAARGHA